MSAIVYFILCGALTLLILLGISLMSKVKTAVLGNQLSALAMLGAIVLTLIYYEILQLQSVLIIVLVTMIIGIIVGMIFATKVKMIQMPQLVALLNGLGGAASSLVGAVAILTATGKFELMTAYLALIIGTLTLTGSLIAAAKLAAFINGRPKVLPFHQGLSNLLILSFFVVGGLLFIDCPIWIIIVLGTVLSALFGIVFTIRIGGADMPITISLLNSLSGVAGSIAGMAIGDPLLVAVGGIVGASGLLLTQIMCQAMNSSLSKILLGKTSVSKPREQGEKQEYKGNQENKENKENKNSKYSKETHSLQKVLKEAKSVILVPGYGMALAQAQHLMKQLANKFEQNGATVKFAIHPVAGRMPGHMNVLLAEADVDYEELYEMDAVNNEFKDTDLCIVVGANDVINPAAKEAEGTPIYGMPILNVSEAKQIIICNYDTKPGYAGVDNPLYENSEHIHLLLGDAKESLSTIIHELTSESKTSEKKNNPSSQEHLTPVLKEAKSVILVPGYGMALAQAQYLMKQLANKFEQNGASVKYAIHPVAGRMPGHMNVLLAEADVDYEELYEMDVINDEFKDTDLCIVVGANDVINPAAKLTEGTPIYGMPILNVSEAKHIIICNYDTKPGYAGVDNPLYENEDHVHLLLGDAKESITQLLNRLASEEKETVENENNPSMLLRDSVQEAKSVILVPGYGMALAQAQHLMKQLANGFKRNGATVKFAIHPVAGRMPGHMNVLLAEADVDYEELYEMEAINDEFKDTDLCIVVGANDVINPAAKQAEGTPIYGMPILNVSEAKRIIICNYDTKPGYAGVDNPLYENKDHIHLLLGDAKESIEQILSCFD